MKYLIKLTTGIILGFFWYFLMSQITSIKPDPVVYAMIYLTGLVIIIKE